MMKSNRFFWAGIEWVLALCMTSIYAQSADTKAVRMTYGNSIESHKGISGVAWSKEHASCNPFDKDLSAGMLSHPEEGDSSKKTQKLVNTPPVVKITAPAHNYDFEWGSQVAYAIQVSDIEDGRSENLEIASNEVFMEAVYLPDAAMAPAYMEKRTHMIRDSPGFYLLRVSDCFNCHDVKTRLQGPSFLEIAKRYPHTPAAVKMLAGRVIEGSSGNWGIPAMSSHPDLTEAQAAQIVQWIFDNAEDPNHLYYSGTKGIIQIPPKPGNGAGGVYVLTASYTDHGIKNMPQTNQTGQHTLLLRSKEGQ
jgi:cytochrome c